MASLALRMNGNNLEQDLEQDVNWAVDDLSEITALFYAVGDRIAQLIIWPVVRARFVPVESLPGSHRGQRGFGSTGYGEGLESTEGASA